MSKLMIMKNMRNVNVKTDLFLGAVGCLILGKCEPSTGSVIGIPMIAGEPVLVATEAPVGKVATCHQH